ncbi:hypothetical protein ACVRY7_00725 [Streptococcus ictaluri]|uniref:Uncharacterized protein n=1 Tax=Streptococcus ictaluri 707-05 TaxID=764299 RepID=G5K3I8_9STRE|nr:hypothetical protein [Streptococcus ictaluri]EHI69862.1 hypothetical protein STRIC_1358 [Streptococcus ictaluri 707-05]
MKLVAKGQGKKSERSFSNLCNASVILCLLLAMLVTLFLFRYNNSSIDGVWRSTTIDEKLGDEFAKKIAGLNGNFSIDEKLLKTPEMLLEIKGNKVTLSFRTQIDKMAFINHILEYQKKELLKTLNPNETSSDQLSLDEQKVVEESLPSFSELEQLLDQALSKVATNIGGQYDGKSGRLSAVVLKGRVNRILRTIDIKELPKYSSYLSKETIEGIGYFDYIKYGRRLELLGEEKLTFYITNQKEPV